MSDLATSRIPRETLAGLLADQRDRITAPMPIVQLDELLGKESQPAALAVGSEPELVVRFKGDTATSKHVIAWSFVLTVLVAALIFILV
jgi:hypothetical protein